MVHPSKREKPFFRKRPKNVATAKESIEARAATLIGKQMMPGRVQAKLIEEYGVTVEVAKKAVSDCYHHFWESITEFGREYGHIFGARSWLAGIMLDYAIGLRRSIEIAMRHAEQSPTALLALEKLQRQYGELWGLLSSGPTFVLDAEQGQNGRVRLTARDESQAKTVLARLSECNERELEEYVIRHLPTVAAYRDPSDVATGEEVAEHLQSDDESKPD